MGVKETLNQRNSVYGDFAGGITLLSHIMELIKVRHQEVHGKEMNTEDEECLRAIVNKLTRLAVTPDHADSWRDIQGYGKLAEDMYRGREIL